MLGWANQFNICCFLDSNNYTGSHHTYDYLLAAGCHNYFSPTNHIVEELSSFSNDCNDWLFGHLGYDLKNETENKSSNNIDHVGFPDIFLFQPLTVITITGNTITIACIEDDPVQILKQIQSFSPAEHTKPDHNLAIHARFSREQYIDAVNTIKTHIHRGDCYELNFCQEFYAEETVIDPLSVYNALTLLSPAPFAAYYKWHDKYVMGASPERYIKKTGQTILSQPVKGTIHRDRINTLQDETLKNNLYNSPKDRSENVMVVDLVRNDLSKICTENSVQVAELFGIYSFAQVHQMISSVTGTLKDHIDFADIIKATFPMGSMTGAPKRKVLQLIEQFEKTKRGIFSGSIGYITPEKDFDFNVVIRSMLYNAQEQYLSFQAGGGITFYSDAAQEYEECMLKIQAIKTVLGSGEHEA